jgi:hypothetical protein
LSADQIGCHRRKPIVLARRPTIFDPDTLPFHKAALFDAFEKGCVAGISLLRTRMQESDHRHCRLLRAGRERPRSRAAEQRNELAPPHSITSSALIY